MIPQPPGTPPHLRIDLEKLHKTILDQAAQISILSNEISILRQENERLLQTICGISSYAHQCKTGINIHRSHSDAVDLLTYVESRCADALSRISKDISSTEREIGA